jgi:hypothetical protein
VNSEGEVLEPLSMKRSEEGANDNDQEFLGTLTLKHPSFRVAVEGRDEGGYPYQRVLPRLIQVPARPKE